MKKMDIEREILWPTTEELEKARQELHKRLIDEEIESEVRREAVNGLISLLKIDRASFRKLWLQPLMMAGATFDMALASIAQSELRPN